MGLVSALVLSSLASAAEEQKVPASLDADQVEYHMGTGEVTATKNVLMKRGTARATGERATYNTNTMDGTVVGNVIVVDGDMRLTCDKLVSYAAKHMQAIGKVHATQLDRAFTGEKVDYFPEQKGRFIAENGGTATSRDGVFVADRMEGWLDDEHYIGTGNAYVNSPTKQMEGGGDRVDYFGKDTGKAILTGNAWATQENNTMHANVITVYLAKDGEVKAAPQEGTEG